MREFSFTVKKEDEGAPIKGLLKRNFSFSSRLFAKLKNEKRIFLNGKPLEGYMNPVEGDVITAVMPDEASNFPPEDIPIDIIYEDQDMMVINKQPGVTVHPTRGHPVHTIANGVMRLMEERNEYFKIRFVSRLDMDTSGILMIAKNSFTQNEMAKQMQMKSGPSKDKPADVEKTYLAVVKDIVEEDEFLIDLPIGRPDPDSVRRRVMEEGGKDAKTGVKVIERYDKGYTLLSLSLLTGRTHQIRVHLSHIGHPIVGDYLYGGDAPFLIERQALHAESLTFNHPGTDKRMHLTAPPADDIRRLIERIK